MLRTHHNNPPAPSEFAPVMRRHALLWVALLVCIAGLNAPSTFAQGIITTVAGNGTRGFSGDGGPAVSAQLDIKHFTGGVATDAVGNVYIADTGNHRVRKITSSGIISTVAGNGAAGFSGDGGPATGASLFAPTGLGVDAPGNLYVVDTGNQCIRRVSPDGIITTVAASLSLGNVQRLGVAGYPTSVAVDGEGNLYIPDTENGRVRKVNPSGIITTVVDGLRDPYGVAVDAAGNLFVTDSSNDQILKVSPSGSITIFAPSLARLASPSGVALDPAGNLYIADSHNHRIRKVEPNGLTKIIAGSGDPVFDFFDGYVFVGGFSGDGGPATSALLNFPWGVAVDAAGNVYIADSLNNRIRKVTAENSGPSPNQIDDAQFFVTEHYRDFLNREPDAGGLAFWTNEIASCGGDAQCIDVKRINVSAAYFLSIEFQQTGYLVYRFYKTAYGNLPGQPVPVRFSEFLPDTRAIGQGVVVNQSGWETVLENNKQAFATEFVGRFRFTSAYPASMSPGEFVDKLFVNAGVTPSAVERAAAINEFGSGITPSDSGARARALRRVSESPTLTQQEFNRAFVLMQYFGYLRRNPNDAPDADYTGYNFWLNKLDSFNGNYLNAEMVKAFIASAEYRQRFGP